MHSVPQRSGVDPEQADSLVSNPIINSLVGILTAGGGCNLRCDRRCNCRCDRCSGWNAYSDCCEDCVNRDSNASNSSMSDSCRWCWNGQA